MHDLLAEASHGYLETPSSMQSGLEEMGPEEDGGCQALTRIIKRLHNCRITGRLFE